MTQAAHILDGARLEAGGSSMRHLWWRQAHSLKIEIALGFGVVIALMIVLGASFHLSAQRSVFAINKLLKGDARMADLSLRSAQEMLKARRAESNFLLSVDRLGVAEARERYISLMQSSLLDMRVYLASVRIISLDPILLEKISRIEQQSQEYESGFLAFVDQYSTHGRAVSGVEEQLSYVIAARAIEPLLEDLHTTATKQSVKTRDGVESAVEITRWTVFVTVAIATVLAVIVAFILSRRISGSVAQLIAFSKRVAAGDFSARAEDGSELEFAILARAMNQMAASIQNSRALLQETQTQLLVTARQAGMAEIANNVLHNVGNVLNSVNVSAGLVNSAMRDSKAGGLIKAVQLMDEHAADLGNFLTCDEKGKRLPGYLNKLAVALAAERQSVVEELGSLTKSVDHIKDIVAIQQSYSGAANVIETVQVGELLEEALRMHAGALARHQVTVIKEFAEIPPIPLDRSHLLQIMVNLIANAKQAMDDVADRPRRMTLRVDAGDDGRRLRIRVEDGGVGIAPENLTRLFVHGFTTRKGGHGFGLHSCALAAKGMGGTLAAQSDGPGKGATFTLELPIQAVEDR